MIAPDERVRLIRSARFAVVEAQAVRLLQGDADDDNIQDRQHRIDIIKI